MQVKYESLAGKAVGRNAAIRMRNEKWQMLGASIGEPVVHLECLLREPRNKRYFAQLDHPPNAGYVCDVGRTSSFAMNVR